MILSISDKDTKGMVDSLNELNYRASLRNGVLLNSLEHFDLSGGPYVDFLENGVSLILYDENMKKGVISNVITEKPYGTIVSCGRQISFAWGNDVVSQSINHFCQKNGYNNQLVSFIIGGKQNHRVSTKIIKNIEGQLEYEKIPIMQKEVFGNYSRLVYPFPKEDKIYVCRMDSNRRANILQRLGFRI